MSGFSTNMPTAGATSIAGRVSINETRSPMSRHACPTSLVMAALRSDPKLSPPLDCLS